MSSFRDDSDYVRIEEFEAGCFQFKINYKELQKKFFNSFITSSVIKTGRVHWVLSYSDACGTCVYHPKGFVSLNILIKSWFNYHEKNFELSLLDKAGDPVKTVNSQGGSTYNIPLFIMKVILEEVALVDGCFFVQCKTSEAVPNEPSQKVSLPKQPGNILKSGETADVTVEVNGELFLTHRSILAARSPVFKAQLFGSMIKTKLQYIRIEDMEKETFRHLLHYIYTDTLDDNFGIVSTNLVQHLYVAADRHGIEGLMKKCEERLCKGLSLDSILSSFAFAEQHNCSKLRNACFIFMTEPANLVKLAFTEEYLQFMQNFPGIVAVFRKYANSEVVQKRQSGTHTRA